MTSTPTPEPGPHSRACGWRPHDHGSACSTNCPTCHGRPAPSTPGEGDGRPDTAALLTIGDWLLRTLPGHQGAEQTAAALAHTARWIDAQPPVPPSPAPQADGEVATALRRLEDAVLLDDPNHAVAEAAEVFIRARLAAPSAPVERPDGFAGYTSCPSLPCTGTLAANCAASGDCLVGLALLHLNETCDLQRRTLWQSPAPTDGAQHG